MFRSSHCWPRLATHKNQINNQQYLNLARDQRGHTETPRNMDSTEQDCLACDTLNFTACAALNTIQYPPVAQRRCVNFDEASTVDKHLGSHVTHRNQLGPVLQACVVLFQDLEKEETALSFAKSKVFPGKAEDSHWTVRYSKHLT